MQFHSAYRIAVSTPTFGALNYTLYVLDPADDYWELSIPLSSAQQYMGLEATRDLNTIASVLVKTAENLNEFSFSGTFREKPRVCFFPDGASSLMTPMVFWKDDNNGTTFCAVPGLRLSDQELRASGFK